MIRLHESTLTGKEMKYSQWRSFFLGICLFSLSIFIVLVIYNKGGYDYTWHMASAKSISPHDFSAYYQENPYPMWHILCRIASYILPLSDGLIVAIITSAFTLVSYWIVSRWLKQECSTKENLIIVEFLAFFLFLLGPLYIPWFNSHYYLGQGTPNTWHNPTNLTVRPFAVLAFISISKLMEDYKKDKQISKNRFLILSIVLFLSVLAKPSFILMVIPGLGLFMLVTFLRDKGLLRFYLQIILAFVPAAVLFFSQYLMLFASGERGSSVTFGWLTVMHLYTPSVIISFVLVFAFPIYLFALDWRESIKDISVQLALCCLCSGWMEAAALLEDGSHMGDGNFLWGLYVAMVFVWMISIKRFAILSQRRKNICVRLGWILLILHICFGIFYMGMLLFHPGFTTDIIMFV